MTDLASLTRDEAEARAALLAVDRYDLLVDWRGLLDGTTSRSVATIAFRCRQPGADTFVDAAGDVVSATLNGRPLDVASVERGRLPLTDLAAENTLVVEMTQDNLLKSEGILRTVDPSDGLVYVWTSFEPDDARKLWACFDQPDLKAPHAFTVLAPESWTVTSNGGPDSVTEPDGGARTWRFPDTPALSTYVVVVNAGPFHEIRERRGGHDLGLFARQSRRSSLERDAQFLFDITERGLAFFAERFDMPFPQERYDQVFVPNMGGAMENWGCVTYADGFIRTSSPTHGELASLADTMLHEMAHMWFGDLVTMKWWEDLWLNEAFASLASTWASAQATQFTDAWASYHCDWKFWGYDEDSSPGTHPIRGVVPDVAQAMANFDGISYAKGQAVLAQLMHLVGEDAFSAGLAAYFRRHAWGNTSLSDLTDAIGAAAGRDLQAWTTGWLDSAGTDAIRLDDGAVVVDGPDGPSTRSHRLDIGSYVITPSGLERVALTPVETSGERTAVDLPDADLHLVNDEDLTFARVRLDDASLETLLAHAHELPTPIARALAFGTLRALVQDGLLPTEDALGALMRILSEETSPGLIRPLLTNARVLARRWAPTDRLDEAARTVADAVRPLCEHPEFGDEARRTLAAVTSSDADFEALAPAAAQDVELAWLIQRSLARLGRYDEAAVAALQERDPDPEAWVQALGVRTARPLDEAKAEAWNALYEERSVPADKLATVAGSFWLPEQADLLAPWCDRYLEALPALATGSMLSMFGLTGGMFPTVADEAFLTRAEAMAAEEGTHPVIRSALVNEGDQLRRMIRARHLHAR